MTTHGYEGGVTLEELRDLTNAPVYTRDGEKFGLVGEIWYDETSNQARYLKVGRGALGLRAVSVPVQGATRYEDGIQLPYAKDQLEGAPDWGDEGGDEVEWTDDRDREFAGYYDQFRTGAGDTDAAITRSEEELSVGTREVDAGSVRLRKWVDTETAQADVELRRETAQVVREPIDQPVSGSEIGDEEAEITLRAEEPVVSKQVVAKERVGIETDVETERQTVSDEVRKERVEIDGADADRR
jgi:uncharacterized protein (TIGR02271 family)